MTNLELSASEAERYDRQIRLWGIESQEKYVHNLKANFNLQNTGFDIFRLRAANALLIGIRGLGSEIAKNILLCGINSLTILDNGVVTQEEQIHNFLLTPDTIGSKVRKPNSRFALYVTISIDCRGCIGKSPMPKSSCEDICRYRRH